MSLPWLVTLVKFPDFSGSFCHSFLGYKWLLFCEERLRTRNVSFLFFYKIPMDALSSSDGEGSFHSLESMSIGRSLWEAKVPFGRL